MFEVIINVLYIVGRVDLRFYRPDVLPVAVRAIITAEQTYYPSSDEEEDGFHRDRPETYGKLRGRAEHGTHVQQPHPYYANGSQELAFDDDEDDYDDFEDIDSQEWDFSGNQNGKTSHSSEDRSPEEYQKQQQEQLPYPVHNEKHTRFEGDDDDNESEFNF